MTNDFRCPECGSPNPVFSAINESIVAMTRDLALEPMLWKIADVARSLVHASYAAIGVTDEQRFVRFVVSGMTEEQIAAVGPLTDRHGLLWNLVAEGRPYRTSDLEQHPDFAGWPEHHPAMRSLLGIPIVSREAVIGAFFLANENTWGFSKDDEALIRVLATHAAIAVDNARLLEQSRELSVVQERNRLARDLHDSVTQMLFSIALAAETGLAVMESDPEAAKLQLKKLSESAKSAQKEMRSLIFELRPAELEAEGLVTTLRKHVDAVRSIYAAEIDLICEDLALPARVQTQLFRILQEALHNAMKHSSARRIEVRLEREDASVVASVKDDGVGLDHDAASARRGHLGLISMRERAASLGAKLDIVTQRGAGTEVRLIVPVGAQPA